MKEVLKRIYIPSFQINCSVRSMVGEEKKHGGRALIKNTCGCQSHKIVFALVNRSLIYEA